MVKIITGYDEDQNPSSFVELFPLMYTKIREVKDPVKAHDSDAGIDFFIPNDFKETTLTCNNDIFIPLGIKILIPRNMMLLAGNKSGVSRNFGLVYGGGVIDSGYEGEICIQMIKVTGPEVTLFPGMKIIQFIPIQSPNINLCKITNNEFSNNCNSKRGDNGYGSTGYY